MSKGFGGSDFAKVVSDRESNAVLSQVLQRNRDQEQRALARQAEGTHGICEDCGLDIDPERVRFIPEATRCVDCQAEQDARDAPGGA
jgi:DnaK suppressor protein